MRALVIATMFISLLLGGRPVRASAAESATALFQEGVTLMQRGHCEGPDPDRALCEQARARFARAFALYPEGLGALRNLAFVDRGLGHLRAARDGFRELEQRARVHENPERRAWAAFARKDAEALQARIPTLTVEVPADLPDDAIVALDGEALPRQRWGRPLERDPGEAELVVSRAGDVRYQTRVALEPGAHKTILVALSAAPASANRAQASAPPPTPSSQPSLVGPLSVMAAGGGITAAGLLIGYLAIRKRDEVCDSENLCDPRGLEDGRRLAHVSTAVTATGVVALAAGAFWWWHRSHDARASTMAVTALVGGAPGVIFAGRF